MDTRRRAALSRSGNARPAGTTTRLASVAILTVANIPTKRLGSARRAGMTRQQDRGVSRLIFVESCRTAGSRPCCAAFLRGEMSQIGWDAGVNQRRMLCTCLIAPHAGRELVTIRAS